MSGSRRIPLERCCLLMSATERPTTRIADGTCQVSTEGVPTPPMTTVAKDPLHLVQHDNEHCHAT